ncbi:DUF981 family protein [Pseudonocardia sp. CA-142604]|uniref:DUF981 family protein n=1 Tax=Pseudonocardia sp. CA-142604 TaxID=3240024 RepID=UPI003D8F9174
MGFCAGLVLLIVADAVRRYPRVVFPGHSIALLVTGAPLTVFSVAGVLTWPLTIKPPINIAFFEPSVMLGFLALVGAASLLRRGDTAFDLATIERFRPVMWIVFAIGLMLISIASAIFSYDLVGDAPAGEPLTSRFPGWENPAFGVAYLLVAAGCLATPRSEMTAARFVMRWSWTLSGAFFLLFSILNYRTHIGLLENSNGAHYRW